MSLLGGLAGCSASLAAAGHERCSGAASCSYAPKSSSGAATPSSALYRTRQRQLRGGATARPGGAATSLGAPDGPAAAPRHGRSGALSAVAWTAPPPLSLVRPATAASTGATSIGAAGDDASEEELEPQEYQRRWIALADKLAEKGVEIAADQQPGNWYNGLCPFCGGGDKQQTSFGLKLGNSA